MKEVKIDGKKLKAFIAFQAKKIDGVFSYIDSDKSVQGYDFKLSRKFCQTWFGFAPVHLFPRIRLHMGSFSIGTSPERLTPFERVQKYVKGFDYLVHIRQHAGDWFAYIYTLEEAQEFVLQNSSEKTRRQASQDYIFLQVNGYATKKGISENESRHKVNRLMTEVADYQNLIAIEGMQAFNCNAPQARKQGGYYDRAAYRSLISKD